MEKSRFLQVGFHCTSFTFVLEKYKMLTYNHLYTVTVIITEREAIYNLGLYICVHVGVTFAYKEFSLFLNLKKKLEF